jgi:peptidoglycan/xylan/chitin deacetylase (PgdA/CDA1 family)
VSLFRKAAGISKIYLSLGLARAWKGVRFLCYHNVFEKKEAIPEALRHFSISSDEFKNHLRLIDQLGIRVVSMREALSLLDRFEADAGQYVCITFDDGYMDNYTVAWPILKEYRYAAHFFICSNLIGKKSGTLAHMGSEEVLSFVKDGGSIGSHAHDHVILAGSKPESVLEQVTKSKHILESIVDTEVDTFAYPNSQFTPAVVNAVRQAGYRFAFAIGLGTTNRISGANRYYISRNIMFGEAARDNELVLRGAYDWASAYSRLQSAVKARFSFRRVVET